MIGDMVNRQTGRYRYIKELKELKRELERVGFTKKKTSLNFKRKFYVRKRERERQRIIIIELSSFDEVKVSQAKPRFLHDELRYCQLCLTNRKKDRKK